MGSSLSVPTLAKMWHPTELKEEIERVQKHIDSGKLSGKEIVQGRRTLDTLNKYLSDAERYQQSLDIPKTLKEFLLLCGKACGGGILKDGVTHSNLADVLRRHGFGFNIVASVSEMDPDVLDKGVPPKDWIITAPGSRKRPGASWRFVFANKTVLYTNNKCVIETPAGLFCHNVSKAVVSLY